MVWGPWTLVIFLGVGIFFTLKCHFFQIRGFLFWWSRTAGRLISGEAFGKEDRNGRADGTVKGKGISQFQSVCTALAATVGTGNIAGVATALTAGGPGALFWMWISALIGMITAYAETMLGISTGTGIRTDITYADRLYTWKGDWGLGEWGCCTASCV